MSQPRWPLVRALSDAVLLNCGYGGALAESGGSFTTCRHHMVVAMQILHGGPWRLLLHPGMARGSKMAEKAA